MKIHHSYFALCVAVSLHVPHALAEKSQLGFESDSNQENIELDSELSISQQEANLEPYAEAEIVSDTVDPVEGLSNFYSDMDMRVRLAVKADAQACNLETCAENQAFDAKVQLIGESLAKSAYALYPDLINTTPKFEFDVVDKKVLGSASNASGKIVLFRSIQYLDLDDTATAFIIGREMGHVIARHHKSNAKTKIFFTVLTGVLFPAATLLSASSAAAQATTATTLMTSAASTVTSFVGSEVALSRIKPGQLSEADNISLELLAYGDVSALDAAQSLDFIVKNEASTGWEKDLNLSIDNIRVLAGDPVDVTAQLEPLPEAYVEFETNIVTNALALAEASEIQGSQIQAFTDTPPHSEPQHIQPAKILPEHQSTQQLPIEQKSVEQKQSEQAQTIWITNETLAQTRNTKNSGLKNSAFKRTSATSKSTKKVLTRPISDKNITTQNSTRNMKKLTKPNKTPSVSAGKSIKIKAVKVLKKSDPKK